MMTTAEMHRRALVRQIEEYLWKSQELSIELNQDFKNDDAEVNELSIDFEMSDELVEMLERFHAEVEDVRFSFNRPLSFSDFRQFQDYSESLRKKG